MSVEFNLEGLEEIENWINDTVSAHIVTDAEPDGQTVSAFKHLKTSEELREEAD